MKKIESNNFSRHLKKYILASKKDTNLDPEQVALGIQEEMKNTFSRSIAKEIAIDRLTTDPDYYKKK